jgi:hypothetical protein
MSPDGDMTRSITTLGPRRRRPMLGGIGQTIDERMEPSDMHGQDDWPCNDYSSEGGEVRLW